MNSIAFGASALCFPTTLLLIEFTFTLFMLASKRNCWTTFFIAMVLDPDILETKWSLMDRLRG